MVAKKGHPPAVSKIQHGNAKADAAIQKPTRQFKAEEAIENSELQLQ